MFPVEFHLDRLVMLDGDEIVVFDKNAMVALCSTLMRTDPLSAGRLKTYLTGVWDLSI